MVEVLFEVNKMYNASGCFMSRKHIKTQKLQEWQCSLIQPSFSEADLMDFCQS